MDDAGVTEFAMNRLFYDMVNNPGGHAGEAGYHRRQDRFLVALEGRFLDSGQWRAYYQLGHSDVWYTRDNNLIPSRLDRKSVGQGKGVSVRFNSGGGGIII